MCVAEWSLVLGPVLWVSSFLYPRGCCKFQKSFSLDPLFFGGNRCDVLYCCLVWAMAALLMNQAPSGLGPSGEYRSLVPRLSHTILTDRVSLRTDSRPTAIAPLDHALRDNGTVPICALTRARSISTVRRCRTAPGTSFRCSLALCTSSCSGASEDRSVGSGAPAIHTHILNDTSGMPFVFMRRQGCHYFYADALKK